MKMSIKVFTAIVLVTALPSLVSAQMGRRRASSGGFSYDTAQEIAIAGTVQGTQSLGEELGQPWMVLTAVVDGENLYVFMGPPEFIAMKGFVFEKGAEVRIRAVPGLRFDGEAAVMAREIRAGEHTLTLRDAEGKPAWDGGGAR